MAGKLAKLAAGVMMTHWTRSKVDNELLADVTTRAGGERRADRGGQRSQHRPPRLRAVAGGGAGGGPQPAVRPRGGEPARVRGGQARGPRHHGGLRHFGA
jgi:hypothetical protein